MAELIEIIRSPKPKWITAFARFGLTAKGIVYCLIGLFAFMAAFNLGSKSTGNTDKQSVFRFLLEQPFGKILLGLLAFGLVCYALWRFVQAIKDTEHKGNDGKGIGRRIGYFFSGIVYAALAFAAGKLVLNFSEKSGGSDSRQMLAQELLNQSWGQWALGIIGLATIGMGINQIYRGVSGKYKKEVQSAGLNLDIEDKMVSAGKFGYISQGIVWLIIGYLFMKAAWFNNYREAGGTDSAFKFLEEASYGPYLLGAVGLGLICYGGFMFMRARYQPISTS